MHLNQHPYSSKPALEQYNTEKLMNTKRMLNCGLSFEDCRASGQLCIRVSEKRRLGSEPVKDVGWKRKRIYLVKAIIGISAPDSEDL